MNLPTDLRSGSYLGEGLGENLFLTHFYSAYTVRSSTSGVSSYSFKWKALDGLARESVIMWMASPPHRSNLLSPVYRSIGIGAARTTHETVIVTCNFSASPESALAVG